MAGSNIDAIKSMYDERSEKYDDSFHVSHAEEFIKAAKPKDGESVLDLACGTGLVAHMAKEKVGPHGHVVGVDLSEGMLDVARRKCEQNNAPDITFIQRDISDLKDLELLPDGSDGFDVITCAAALVLLPKPLQAVKNWVSLLKPGGRLVTDAPVKDVNVPIRIFDVIGKQIGLPLRWDQSWVESDESLRSLLTDAGLIVEDVSMTKTYQVREYKENHAAEIFEQVVASPMFRDFGASPIRDKAKSLFVQKFREEAGQDGVLLDEARLYIGVAFNYSPLDNWVSCLAVGSFGGVHSP